MIRRLRLSLPLLSKELHEQAARGRTYAMRAAYAAALFLFFCLFLREHLDRYAGNPFALLGTGERIFEFLAGIQFAGVYLFLPAMTCGVLAAEKERGSFELLLLTDLSPSEILLQKFYGRLVPMGTFLLLSLPLLAIAYAFGGIPAARIGSAGWFLLLACLQVGALSLMVSAWCRTTALSFVGSYVLLAAFCLALPLAAETGLMDRGKATLALVPPFLFIDTEGAPPYKAALRSLPTIVSIAAFVLLARLFLIRRAFLPQGNLLLKAFRRLDAFFHKANRAVGGVVLVRERRSLPDGRPIAWRELSKRALGSPRHLLRILVLLEVPCLLLGALLLGHPRRDAEEISVAIAVLWGIAILSVSVLSAGAISSERTRGTLDVLLTTPLSGAEIVRQKMQGVRRLVSVFFLPFLTLFLFEAWWEGSFGASPAALAYFPGYGGSGPGRVEIGWLPYVGFSVVSLLAYLPAAAWFSCWLGLALRSRGRAILASLGAVAGWLGGPILLYYLLLLLLGPAAESTLAGLLYAASPVAACASVEASDFSIFSSRSDPKGQFLMIPLNLVLHAWLALVFYALSVRRPDRYLGRLAPGRPPAPPAPGEAAAPQPGAQEA